MTTTLYYRIYRDTTAILPKKETHLSEVYEIYDAEVGIITVLLVCSLCYNGRIEEDEYTSAVFVTLFIVILCSDAQKFPF